MKIAFVTACLEQGRDGVGDYTSLLAAECTRRGHVVRMIALNDVYASDSREPASANTLRLSPSLPWPERVDRARVFLSAFVPDCISLQFVCYGFHPRGLDFEMPSHLREIVGDVPVQIMFHELWIGAGARAGFKERIIGALQRSIILRMLRALNVRAVHTNTAAYAALLRKRGISAAVLPLFGSIPPASDTAPPHKRDGTLVFGMFGALHPVWPPEPLLSMLRSLDKKIVIAHIGRIGPGEALWKRMEHDYAGAITFRPLGEQPPERIARFFHSEIDFGIATTPWELTGKSATVAAMLEHGLPVIVNRDDWRLPGLPPSPPASPLLIKMDDSLPQKIAGIARGEPRFLLSSVADQFLADLDRSR